MTQQRAVWGVLTLGLILLCIPATAHAQCPSNKKSDVLFVVDQSPPWGDYVWRPAHGFCDAFDAFDSRLRFGLMFFNASPTLHEPIGENTAANICKHFGTIRPTGPSNFYAAFVEIEAMWKKVIAADSIKDRPRYVVLLSYMEHNGADPSPLIKRMFNPGVSVDGANYSVKTFAIGYGDTGKLPKLDQYAIYGGTQKAYYVETNFEAFKTILPTIFAQAVQPGCFPPEAPQEETDPEKSDETNEEHDNTEPIDITDAAPGPDKAPEATTPDKPTPEQSAEQTPEQPTLGDGDTTTETIGCGCNTRPTPPWGLALLLLLSLLMLQSRQRNKRNKAAKGARKGQPHRRRESAR